MLATNVSDAPKKEQGLAINTPSAPIILKPERAACIVVIYGPELGRRAALGRATFEIGRASKSDLAIDEESVSRHHARIVCGEGVHFIQDLGSTNGTQVNDHGVREPAALSAGDQIKIGRSILKYIAGEDLETNYHEEIYRLMTVDALTQTYNKRYFNEALEREYNRSVRYQRELSLVSFDLDDFKAINDAHGHVVGDAVLRQLASAIKPKLRQQDIFARVGGGDFTVLLPEVSLETARIIAEKIRRIVETAVVVHEGKSIPCTVSLGVASFAKAMGSPAMLSRAAHAQVTEAKKAGKNRLSG